MSEVNPINPIHVLRLTDFDVSLKKKLEYPKTENNLIAERSLATHQ